VAEVINMVEIIEHKKKTDYAKFLIELGEENKDFEPVYFCVLSCASTFVGGYESHVYFYEGDDRLGLISFIGMLEEAKHLAFKRLQEIDEQKM